jgi:DNA-binding CsgD family transcriptional regulator
MDAELRRMMADGRSSSVIARCLGIGKKAVKNRYRLLGIANKLSGRIWAQHEVETAARMHSEGASFGRIARAIGKTKASVKTKITRRIAQPVGALAKAARPHFVPAGPNDDEARRMAASLLHLIDLKRAGHSPARTELRVPRDYGSARVMRPALGFSVTGSSAADCAVLS